MSEQLDVDAINLSDAELITVLKNHGLRRRVLLKVFGAGAVMTAVGPGTTTANGRGGGEPLFEFTTMVGNQGPFVGSDGAIRDVAAGGLPWVVDEAEAKLDDDGRLKVEVQGLVLDPDDERVPDDLAGTNPVPEFKAIVSCLTFEGDTREMVNAATDTVPASEDGDAEIEEELDLPEPCYAPIVFVTSPGGSWFATTGG